MASPTQLRIDVGSDPPIPPIAALFLVNFDHRKGYTLGWHRTIENVQIEGVVEFKSLPSGLHNVEEDLVYFIHDDYAGLSAFVKKADEESERSARMAAVGVLVPLEQGRIGRSWRHAISLQQLARDQITDLKNTALLEEYWNRHKLQPDGSSTKSPADANGQRSNGYRKARSMSTATTFMPAQHKLMPHHPAATLLDAFRTFGPLLFPVYRAALLRKRILIVTDTPVEFCCNLVYNISILSSASESALSQLQSSAVPEPWLKPLYTVGVLDIPQLEETRRWIACTTDDVLSTKPNLYDVLVFMPLAGSEHASPKAFPRIVHSTPQLSKTFPSTSIKASERDFSRFVHLQQALHRYPRCHIGAGDTDEEQNDDAASVSSHSSAYFDNKAVIEPASWSKVAYTSLVWWASAGDRRAGLTDAEEGECEQDLSLLQDEGDDQTQEVALVAYFHRMTERLFGTVAAAVARTDGEEVHEEYHDQIDGDEDALGESTIDHQTGSGDQETEQLLSTKDGEPEIEITQEDMAAMGLDSWSTSDKRFVEEFIQIWWGRKAAVHAAVIECCGLRIL
ncbi:hypothetical protein PV08_11017 [Exophiala spinifera]|uniref:DUF4484 domain-containing protein n=1 Tax=Exophiala spinifera TaxID=91928 RepID=A0A0D2AZ20_9EURO|nr:uncharacterized protein PV08_11017 [Exophiala spinifera]KIW11715.1 hypothetical protein PV08_11017 [Exophiala spinifera]